MNEIIEKEGIDYVVCPYCEEHLPMISWSHLKFKHGKTLKELKEEFPNIKTSSLKSIEKKKMAGLKSKLTCNQTKKINCCYCGKEIQVKNNESNTQACKECLDKGLKNPDKRTSKEAQKRREETMLKKYGVRNSHQTIESIEKAKQTNRERYGGVGFASNELAQKTQSTIKEKYNVDNIMKVKSVAQKIGVMSTKKNNPERAKKISESLKGRESKLKGKTWNDIFGVEKAKQLIQKRREKAQKEFLQNFEKYLNEHNVELVGDYINAFHEVKFRCKTCNHIFTNNWNNVQQGYLCPKCYPRNDGTSKPEKDICEFIKSLDSSLTVDLNNNKIIHPKQIDIYIPEKKIGIEFNGLYWHSETHGKDRKYHLEKTLNCLQKNIQLIHIFEDEWLFKQDIVKNRLKQILNYFNGIKIYARKCIIKEIETKIKNEFLEKYHIQGKDSSVIKLGAYYNDKLLAVMTFSHGNISKGSTTNKEIWELNRFCSNYDYHIPGIASKLLTYFKRNYKWEEIFSYADRRWSIGNVYEKLGFELNSITQPNYWYIQGLHRIHRFGLRKRPDEPKNITEWELRQKEGYDRIWDCGNLKYVIKQ